MKVLQASFSPMGGAGNVAKSVGETLSKASGVEVDYFFLQELNLRKAPLENPVRTFRAFFDEFFVKKSSKATMITLNRAFNYAPEDLGNYDVIHFHWWYDINIAKLAEQLPNSTFVFTLHDDRALTGVCHSSGSCSNFIEGCQNCPVVRAPYRNEVARSFTKTRNMLSAPTKVKFVAPSEWMQKTALSAGIDQIGEIVVIPNPISNSFWVASPSTGHRAYDPKNNRIKFGFLAENINDPNKRLDRALNLVKGLRGLGYEVSIEIVGGGKVPYSDKTSSEPLGRLSTTELIQVASSWDALISSSESENAPVSIVEMAALGVPTVTHSSDPVDEILRKTGQRAIVQNWGAEVTDEFAEVLVSQIRGHQNSNHLRVSARENFGPEVVRQKLLKLYEVEKQ